MTSNRFRLFLALSMISAIAAMALEILFQASVPTQLNESINGLPGQPADLKILIGLLLAIVSAVMSIISAIGMYAFKLWAPKLALNSTFLAGLAIMLSGAGLANQATSTLTYASTVLWGSVLAIAHTPAYIGYAKSAAKKLLGEA
jgi:hypothetical protein